MGRAVHTCPPHDRPVAALEVFGVTKSYAGRAALAGVELRVQRGSVVGLVGPNGSGKTTLLHVAAGLVRADAGRVTVDGSPAGSARARAALAFVPDEPHGFEELTVAELVELVHGLWRACPPAGRRAKLLCEAFGLSERLGTRLGALSRGQRRQASMAAALSLDSPLLLVDEATATLDPEAIVVLRATVATLAGRGTGVLVATQDLHFAERACDDVVLLAQGHVLERGSPPELCEAYGAEKLEDVFLAAVGERTLDERVRRGLAAL